MTTPTDTPPLPALGELAAIIDPWSYNRAECDPPTEEARSEALAKAEAIHALYAQALTALAGKVEEKRAPVQGWAGGIPWDMHLRAYEVYCKKWSPQPAMIDLEGRNCRGGFATDELDDFIPGWRDELSERTRLKQELATLTARNKELEEAARPFAAAYESDPVWPWNKIALSRWEALARLLSQHPLVEGK